MSEIRKLITKAYKTPLNITQQKQLENSFTKDPSLILHVDLTPSKVSSLNVSKVYFQFIFLADINSVIIIDYKLSLKGLKKLSF